MNIDFEGKVVVVTGAAHGFGRESIGVGNGVNLAHFSPRPDTRDAAMRARLPRPSAWRRSRCWRGVCATARLSAGRSAGWQDGAAAAPATRGRQVPPAA